MMRFILPFVLFLVLAGFLFKGLSNVNHNLAEGKDPREIASPLVDKAAPTFALPVLQTPDRKFSPEEMRGKVWLLNVWASWCGACKEEHPVLMQLSQQNILPIVGVDYKDKAVDGAAVLSQAGNPYSLVISDADGKAFFNYGVYGVPESYLIDKQGIIRFKLTGAINEKNWSEKLLPLIKELQAK